MEVRLPALVTGERKVRAQSARRALPPSYAFDGGTCGRPLPPPAFGREKGRRPFDEPVGERLAEGELERSLGGPEGCDLCLEGVIAGRHRVDRNVVRPAAKYTTYLPPRVTVGMP